MPEETDEQGGAGRAARIHEAMDAASPGIRADIGAGAAAMRLRRRRAVRRALPAADALDQMPLALVGGAVLAAGLASGRPRLRRAGAEMLVGLALATGIKNVAKRGLTRTRPSVVAETGEHAFAASGADDSDHQAFPSGHTAGAVATLAPLLRAEPLAAAPLVPLTAGLLGLQVVRGAHYPSDIVAGGAVGLLAAALAERIIGTLLPDSD